MMLKTNLDQRGRASFDFLASMGGVSQSVYAELDADIAAAGITDASLPEDLDERQQFMNDALKDSKAFGVIKLMGDWWGKYHGMMAVEAFEDTKEQTIAELTQLDEKDGAAELHLDPEMRLPTWWTDHWIHRTTGGWDGHAYMGYVHGELIHRKMVASVFPALFKQRGIIASHAPKAHYADILDMGASSGHSMIGLQETYPDAQITGIDLSARMLENAYRVAKHAGHSWKLYQRDAADTQFADNSFDLIFIYAVFHETPVDVARDIFAEAHRVCRPGGDIVVNDVTRYKDLSPLEVWRADYSAAHGGEPYWRGTAQLDFSELATEAGFVNALSVSMPPKAYPHYMVATKPQQ
ncbi:MAG: class I SAM-dependent methyltransferase [Pseudomonadota bacterium]